MNETRNRGMWRRVAWYAAPTGVGVITNWLTGWGERLGITLAPIWLLLFWLVGLGISLWYTWYFESTENLIRLRRPIRPSFWKGLFLLLGGIVSVYLAVAILVAVQPVVVSVHPFTGEPSTQEHRESLRQLVAERLMEIDQFVVEERSSSEGKASARESLLTGRVNSMNDQFQASVYLRPLGHGQRLLYSGPTQPLGATVDSIVLMTIARTGRYALIPGPLRPIVRPITQVLTKNEQALEAYARGRARWDDRSYEALWDAIDAFHEAIGRDPQFARAYSGLADAFAMLNYRGYPPRDLYADSARHYAERALGLDSLQAEAYASRGVVRLALDLDLRGAERDFKRATETNRKYVPAHQWYAQTLAYRGTHEQALASARRAVRLSPNGAPARSILGEVLYLSGDMDEAEKAFRHVLNMEGVDAIHRHVAAAWLARTYMVTRNLDKARAQLARVERFSVSSAALGFATLDAWEGRPSPIPPGVDTTRKANLPYVDLALYALAVADPDGAVRYLEQAFIYRDPEVLRIAQDPLFAGLRGHPGFRRLVNRLDLLGD